MPVKLPRIKAGAEPLFFPGNPDNPIACVVIHGFMASPNEVGWLGKALAQEGYAVYVPRLSGHGMKPEYMKRIRWQEWLGQVADAISIMQQLDKKVIVIGHSMGGLLACLAASVYPVEGLVMAASPLTVPNYLMPWARIIQIGLPYTRHSTEASYQEAVKKEQLRLDEAPLGRIHYEKWASRAVYELYQLIKMCPDYLSEIKVPTCLIYSENDETVAIGDVEIAEKGLINAPLIEKHIVKDCGHLLFLDPGYADRNALVKDFIARHFSQDVKANERA
ncbi:alpha/beta fold hydrolase [Anaerolineales bacterium]